MGIIDLAIAKVFFNYPILKKWTTVATIPCYYYAGYHRRNNDLWTEETVHKIWDIYRAVENELTDLIAINQVPNIPTPIRNQAQNKVSTSAPRTLAPIPDKEEPDEIISDNCKDNPKIKFAIEDYIPQVLGSLIKGIKKKLHVIKKPFLKAKPSLQSHFLKTIRINNRLFHLGEVTYRDVTREALTIEFEPGSDATLAREIPVLAANPIATFTIASVTIRNNSSTLSNLNPKRSSTMSNPNPKRLQIHQL